jgi:hypothetical protein
MLSLAIEPLDLTTNCGVFPGEAPLCIAASNNPLSYRWSVAPDLVYSLDASSAAAHSLFVQPLSLIAGVSYAFTCTVTARVDSSGSTGVSVLLQNNATILVSVVSSPLQAVIGGGSARSLPASATITLDASHSNDPDAASPRSGLSHAWSCVTDSGWPCLAGGSRSALELPSVQVASVSAGVLPPGSYIFTLRVSKDVRVDHTNQTVTVLAEDVALEPAPAVSLFTRSPDAINPAASVVVSSAVDYAGSGALSYAWSCESPTRGACSRLWGDPSLLADATLPTLLLNPQGQAGAFQIGAALTFTLSVSAAGAEQGSAKVQFTVLDPPSSGALSVSPASGVAAFTAFTLSASGWSSGASPLSYSFFYVDPASGLQAALTSPTALEAATLDSLPAGDARSGHALTVGVVVTDSTGVSATATTVVTVLPSESALTADVGAMEVLLDAAVGAAYLRGDAELAVPLAMTLAQAVAVPAHSAPQEAGRRKVLGAASTKASVEKQGKTAPYDPCSPREALLRKAMAVASSVSTTAADAVPAALAKLVVEAVR